MRVRCKKSLAKLNSMHRCLQTTECFCWYVCVITLLHVYYLFHDWVQKSSISQNSQMFASKYCFLSSLRGGGTSKGGKMLRPMAFWPSSLRKQHKSRFLSARHLPCDHHSRLFAAELEVMELRDALERLEVCQEVAVPGIPRDRHVAGHLVSNWVSLVAPGRLLHYLCQISHAVAIRATVFPVKHPKAAINETAGMTGDHKRQRNGLVQAEHGSPRQVCQHCLVLVLA